MTPAAAAPTDEAFREMVEDLARRSREIERAKKAARAVRWLASYGETGARDKAISFEGRCSFASACDGYQEATGYMERATLGLIDEIIALAQKLAQSDVDAVFPADGQSQ